MTIRRLELFHLAVPLRKRVKHASHDRSVSDNLLVRITLADGVQGYGEGVPRDYVTGETLESTFAALSRFDVARHMGRPGSYEEVVERLGRLELPESSNDPRGMAANAARCALELAVLDAYGRAFDQSVSTAVRIAASPDLRLRDRPGRVRYSGAITAESERKERISAWKMRIYGFHQVKIKVGVDGQNDPARLGRFRRILGRSMDLRIDANEAWPAGELLERVKPLRPFRPSALEQPVSHREVEALAELRPRMGLPVMLDESICGWPDGVAAVERGLADVFNVRLSKCGGIIPSLRLMGLAFRSGLGVQLGCHPGETAILSAAGRHVATNVDGLRYVEGSYDRHILGGNVTGDDITFGYGGWAPPLAGEGLGVSVEPQRLEEWCVKRTEVRYD